MPNISSGELEHRIERARVHMHTHELDALVITSTPNFRYFTGLDLILLVAPSRPVFLVIPIDGDPTLVIPAIFTSGKPMVPYAHQLETWNAPQPADEGVSLVANVLAGCPTRFGRVGFELGQEMRLGMPVLDYERLRQETRASFVDATQLLWTLRFRKSTFELDCIRQAATFAQAAFEPDGFPLRKTQFETARAFRIRALQAGANNLNYLAFGSGRHGYQTLVCPPDDTPLHDGDVFGIDVGFDVDGYWCDFNRNFAIGTPHPQVVAAHRTLYEATNAGIAATRIGAKASDVWQAMAEVIGDDVVKRTKASRFGHGVGISFTEPPSIRPDDHTVLVEGMVLAIEPCLVYPVDPVDGSADDQVLRLMIHEEDVVVTADGADLLTTRGPESIPAINLG
jgi:Xaa-Pro dipeptidase